MAATSGIEGSTSGHDCESVMCTCSRLSLFHAMASMVRRMSGTGKKWRAVSIMTPRCGNWGASRIETGA